MASCPSSTHLEAIDIPVSQAYYNKEFVLNLSRLYLNNCSTEIGEGGQSSQGLSHRIFFPALTIKPCL